MTALIALLTVYGFVNGNIRRIQIENKFDRSCETRVWRPEVTVEPALPFMVLVTPAKGKTEWPSPIDPGKQYRDLWSIRGVQFRYESDCSSVRFNTPYPDELNPVRP